MYSEIKQSGKKQFLIALIIMLLMYILGSVLNFALEKHPAVRFAVLIIMCCSAVYVIYRRYSAKYTYILEEKSLSVKAEWGHKKDDFSILYKKIDRVICGKQKHLPWAKKYFCMSILPYKDYCYIIYDDGKKALVIEPSDKFLEKLKEHIK